MFIGEYLNNKNTTFDWGKYSKQKIIDVYSCAITYYYSDPISVNSPFLALMGPQFLMKYWPVQTGQAVETGWSVGQADVGGSQIFANLSWGLRWSSSWPNQIQQGSNPEYEYTVDVSRFWGKLSGDNNFL